MSDPCSPDPIEPIDTTVGCVEDNSAPVVPWETRDESMPYIDRRNCFYSIVVDKAYSDLRTVYSPGDVPPGSAWRLTDQYVHLGASGSRRQRVERYVAYGIDRLIEYYNKYVRLYGSSADPAGRSFLIEKAVDIIMGSIGTSAVRYHISTRPGSKMKVLVAFPMADFDRALQDKRYVPRWRESRVRTAEYDVRLIKTKIDLVAKVINDHYGTKRGNPFGNTRNLNLKSESRKMRNFLDRLQSLITENRIDVNLGLVLNTRPDKIRIIMHNDTYQLLDIQYEFGDNQPPRYLRTAWPKMLKETTQTTMGLIYWTKQEIFSDFNNHINPTWTDFVRKYIYPPRDMNMAFGSGIGNLDDINEGVDEALMMAQHVLGAVNFGNDVLSGDASLLPLADNFIKTEAELLLENDNIFNRAFQSNLINHTNRVLRNTDTGPFVDWDVVSSRIGGNLDQLYRHVLNHIDIRYLIAKVAACAGMDALIDGTLLEIIEKLIAFLMWLADMDWSTFDFDWNFLQLAEDLMEDLVNYIFNYLINLVNMAITEFVLWLLEQLDKMCVEDFNYDAVDIGALLSDKFNSAREAAAFYNSLAQNIGGSGPLLRELIRDISAALTTPELCSLLRGHPSVEVTTIAHNIILLEKYNDFRERFETREDIITFFSSLGSLINDSFCELGARVQGVDVCSDSFYQDLRASLLRERNVPEEQITEQLASERARRTALLEQLGEIVNSTDGNVSQRIQAALNSGEIGSAIANHPLAEGSADQMVQSMFINPIVIMANEGLGSLETPYVAIEYKISPAGLARQFYPQNRGIMHIVSDPEQYRYFIWGVTVGSSYSLRRHTTDDVPAPRIMVNYGGGNYGTGMVEQLSLINLNPSTRPLDNDNSHATFTQPLGTESWEYKTQLAKKIGAYKYFSPYVSYKVDYDPRMGNVSWWGDVYPDLNLVEQVLDHPYIVAPFIQRTPMVGFENPPSIPGDALRRYKSRPTSTGPSEKDLAILETHEVQNSRVARTDTNWDIPDNLRLSGPNSIRVFNDLPQVFKDGLIPSYSDPNFVIPDPDVFVAHGSSRQQSAYANLFTSKVLEFIEGEEDLSTASDLRNWILMSTTTREVLNTYQNIFNDVMRTLYRFVTDSEYTYSVDLPMPEGPLGPAWAQDVDRKLNSLRNAFKDSQHMFKLLGMEEVQTNIQDNIASALQGDSNLTEATFDILGESSLRFFIRIYILEIFLKNIYMLASIPERRGTEGSYVIKPGGLGPGGIIGPDNKAFFLGDEPDIPISYRLLDLNDIADPILVSYIAEYMGFSNSEGRVSVRCDAFYEVAHRLASKELQDSGAEFISVAGPPRGDTLAYFPADRTPRTDTPENALRYYIAKELRSGSSGFLSTFQEFIKEVNADSWRREFPASSPTPRSMIQSFLDKLQIVGHNIKSTDLPYENWKDYGEGLYMEFYIKPLGAGLSGQVYQVDKLGRIPNLILPRLEGTRSDMGELHDLDLFGLRVCVRDSHYHKNEGDLRMSDAFRSALREGRATGDIYQNARDRDISSRELAWTPEKGVPIVVYEESWNDLKTMGFSTVGGVSVDRAYLNPENMKMILDVFKAKISQLEDFKVMFEYIFPVRKMFNQMLIMMDQNVSAFLNNTKTRGPTEDGSYDDDNGPLPGSPPAGPPGGLLGAPLDVATAYVQLAAAVRRLGVLPASSIDPEQFRQTKAVAKSILENVNNSDNYRYTNAVTEDAGGIANLSFDNSVEDL